MTMKKVIPGSLSELLEIIKKAKQEGAKIEFVNADTGAVGLPDDLKRALGDKLGEMMGSDDGGCDVCGIDHAKESHAPTAEIANVLLDVLGVHQKPIQFQPGDFVRFRSEIQYVKRARDLHIVLERVDEPFRIPVTAEETGSPFAYRSHDLLIAAQTKHGICKYYTDSRELEYFPDANKLLNKSS